MPKLKREGIPISTYNVEIAWQLSGDDFAANTYSRAHEIRLDGGITIAGSASPQVVPLPFSVEAALDPEEAYVAALSSCHMLWFLDHARQGGWSVAAYTDRAEGVMRRREGRVWITDVVLRPEITWDGDPPTRAEIAALHHASHEDCFIANSVRTDVRVEPA